jgi:hypothetical protein
MCECSFWIGSCWLCSCFVAIEYAQPHCIFIPLLRYAFGLIKGSQNFETVGKHISLSDKNTLAAPANDFSAFLLKSNKQGVPQWVAHIGRIPGPYLRSALISIHCLQVELVLFRRCSHQAYKSTRPLRPPPFTLQQRLPIQLHPLFALGNTWPIRWQRSHATLI